MPRKARAALIGQGYFGKGGPVLDFWARQPCAWLMPRFGAMQRHGPPSRPMSTAPTRERIRAVAADLYVLRGHDGFSFGDIAEAVGTTRANIHHHFGNKRRLMAELAEGFAADAEARIAQHWTAGERSFAQRLEVQLGDLRTFYRRFNAQPGDRNVWSPVSRLRLDMAGLGEHATAALDRVNRAYDRGLGHALADAIAKGEFVRETPVPDVVRLLRLVILSSGPTTQDIGSFAEVEALFAATARTLAAAWGRKPPRRLSR